MDYLSEIKKFYQEYIESNNGSAEGRSPEEVDALEQYCGHELPIAYKQFLLWNGKNNPSITPDFELLAQHGRKNTLDFFQLDTESKKYTSMPRQLFLFYVGTDRFYVKYAWFFLPKVSDNPPVYFCRARFKVEGVYVVHKLTDFLANKQRTLAKYKLSGLVIGATGDTQEWSRKIIDREGGVIGNKDIWQKDQIIVVGDTDFDKQYLEQSIRIGQQHKFTCNYMSEEAFYDFRNYGEYPHYYKGDSRIQRNAGLTFLASIGFNWPSIDPIAKNLIGGNFENLREVHPLKSKYGYSVGGTISEQTRRSALRRAIRSNELGLEAVAKHIASLIHRGRRRRNGQLDSAVYLWESDLAWLHEMFYKDSIYEFVWPM